jgi:decaprenyl-phosphate phosphoribosyltransferase
VSTRSAVEVRRGPYPGFGAIRYVVISLRIHHWIKNLFVFSPLLFSGHFRDPKDLLITCAGFFLFSLSASGVYLFNDILDRERDRTVAGNCDRPLAAGKLGVRSAALWSGILQIVALSCGYLLNLSFVVFLALYVINNVAYSLIIKDKVIVDVISIAVGFIVRILAGGALIGIEVSHWLIVCTFNVAMLLGFGKRRAEMDGRRALRAVNAVYTETKLDHMMGVSAAVTLFSYMMYAVAPETIHRFGGSYLIYTVPFVAYGIFRYIAKVQEGTCRDPIHIIYNDRTFLLNIVLWAMSIIAALLVAYPLDVLGSRS